MKLVFDAVLIKLHFVSALEETTFINLSNISNKSHTQFRKLQMIKIPIMNALRLKMQRQSFVSLQFVTGCNWEFSFGIKNHKTEISQPNVFKHKLSWLGSLRRGPRLDGPVSVCMHEKNKIGKKFYNTSPPSERTKHKRTEKK